MSQHYFDPQRESDPYALPNLEVFYLTASDASVINMVGADTDEPLEPGWYWQSCFPSCLPDSDPCGPFDTEAEALADAREGLE